MSTDTAPATEWKPDIIIYHKHCTDGFAAAWACHRRWGDACQYIPMSYGDSIEHALGVGGACGKHILMVDFSLKRDAMLDLAKDAASVVVLDHHDTAEKELEMFVCSECSWPPSANDVLNHTDRGLSVGYRALAFFDMDKSGCRLAWEFCHPDKPIPRLLEHIEDRDLWRFKIEGTKEVAALLRSYDLDFVAMEELDATQWWALRDEGAAILRAERKHVADFLSHSYLTEVAGFSGVPVLNVPYAYASECGHELLKKYPEAPFAATWFRSGSGKILWSLRSEATREDVGSIAAKMGGGGHRNASGFNEWARGEGLKL